MSEESTTPDLAELQERLADAVGRRDLDAITAIYAPDAVRGMSPTGTGVFEGHVAIRGFWEDWFAAYQEYEFEAEESLDLGNGVGFRVLIQKGRQSVAAPRFSFATQRSACGRTARSCAQRTTPTSRRPVLPPNASRRSGGRRCRRRGHDAVSVTRDR